MHRSRGSSCTDHVIDHASCHSLLAYRVYAERLAVNHIGFPLYVTCCFSLAALNILSLCLVFVSLISMCIGVLSCMGLFAPHELDYFLFHPGEIFSYNLFKNFLVPFLFLFFLWDPYNLNVGVFDIIPEVFETILNSLHSFYFILLLRGCLYHFIFQLTESFFCFRYSAIDSF